MLQGPAAPERGYHALGVMERHLGSSSFFVGGRATIADIALYAYTHVAEEGGFQLAKFPGVQSWLERVRSEKGHIKIGDPAGTIVSWSRP